MTQKTLFETLRRWFRSIQHIRVVSDPRDLRNLPKGSIIIAGTRITVIEPRQ